LRGCPEVESNLARRSGLRAPNCPYCGPGAASTTCSGVGKSGSPTSRWMASGSCQASSMTSRMRQTGMEPAIEEAGVDISPERVVISLGGHGLPPLCAPRQVIGWQARHTHPSIPD
jgi:hypothetical protein